MANTLGIFDPVFYASEALLYLTNRLGLASRVYRQYDPAPQQKGSTISIAQPGTFVASAMPGTGSDITPLTVSLVLNNWNGVVLQLNDKELAYTKEKIIQDHVGPAAYAVANQIDIDIAKLYMDVPWNAAAAGPPSTEADIIAIRKIQLNQRVPLQDGLMHFMVSPSVEADWLGRSLFNQANTSSDGADSQRRGVLGQKFGYELFANQNVQTHVDVAMTIVGAVTVTGATAQYATAITITAATTLTGTLKKGDVINVTTGGVVYSYACTTDTVAAANALTNVPISPVLRVAALNGDTATISQFNGKQANLAFHRNAFALGMGTLSELGDGKGASIGSVSDPVTGLALRSTVWYDGNNGQLKLRIDALYGVKTLNPDLAARLHY